MIRQRKKQKLRVGVVDYGMGNLHSVAKAFEVQGASVSISDQRAVLSGSDLLVVPGVGSFGAAMTTLAKKKLDDFLCQWVEQGRSYVGICLGFQLLFQRSEESPGVKGLGVLEGDVVRFQFPPKKAFQIPHMGWNQVECVQKEGQHIFNGIRDKEFFYFLHTFYPVPKNRKVVLSQTDYGSSFCSSISWGPIFASQFHPEKSGRAGLKLIRNLLDHVA